MLLTLKCEREGDGRFLAGVAQLPGVQAWGSSPNEAITKVEVLALRALAERLERGAPRPLDIRISLAASAA